MRYLVSWRRDWGHQRTHRHMLGSPRVRSSGVWVPHNSNSSDNKSLISWGQCWNSNTKQTSKNSLRNTFPDPGLFAKAAVQSENQYGNEESGKWLDWNLGKLLSGHFFFSCCTSLSLLKRFAVVWYLLCACVYARLSTLLPCGSWGSNPVSGLVANTFTGWVISLLHSLLSSALEWSGTKHSSLSVVAVNLTTSGVS